MRGRIMHLRTARRARALWRSARLQVGGLQVQRSNMTWPYGRGGSGHPAVVCRTRPHDEPGALGLARVRLSAARPPPARAASQLRHQRPPPRRPPFVHPPSSCFVMLRWPPPPAKKARGAQSWPRGRAAEGATPRQAAERREDYERAVGARCARSPRARGEGGGGVRGAHGTRAAWL